MRSPSAKHPALALTYSPEHIKFVYSVVMLKSPQRGEEKTEKVLCHVRLNTITTVSTRVCEPSTLLCISQANLICSSVITGDHNRLI